MNVRGICCLLPGIAGLTDRITVFSIVGRYLEHTRIYRFGRGEDAALYISSADFMTRNTERRVEVACPVLSPEVRKKIFHIIDVLTSDNVKARQLGPDGEWHARKVAAARRSSRRRPSRRSSPSPSAPPSPRRARSPSGNGCSAGKTNHKRQNGRPQPGPPFLISPRLRRFGAPPGPAPARIRHKRPQSYGS